ncbi:hypothetical protein ES705_50945 [subsurface metagenome]
MIFNRLDTTQKVFNSIRQAKPRQLFVAADGPREGKEGEIEKCQKARKIVSSKEGFYTKDENSIFQRWK